MSVQDYEDRIAKGASGLSTTLAVTLKNTGKYLGRCGFTEYTECAETVGWEIKALEGHTRPPLASEGQTHRPAILRFRVWTRILR
jgi:hypothetical protein